jgi:hypothetical protein
LNREAVTPMLAGVNMNNAKTVERFHHWWNRETVTPMLAIVMNPKLRNGFTIVFINSNLVNS